ncbi:50S ribosomal protein L11 methyltransferase [soil metagenome]
MDAGELRTLLSTDGLRLLDSLPPFDQKADIVKAVADLRRLGHDPALVAAVLTQQRLRARAALKFGAFAAEMLFTEDGLEQATRLRVAAIHAGRFQRAGLSRIADLGSGIGADALAMAGIDLEVTAVERDEVTAAIAAYNLAAFPHATVVHADATTLDLTGFDGVYLDPARRSGGHRLSDPADWSPSLDFAFGQPLPSGIKLGPGIDRDLIPAAAEAQWVSVEGDVVEVGVWTRSLAREGIRRSALVFSSTGVAEMSAPADSEDEATGELGEFVFEPDGAVIRARLIGDLARRLGARMLHRQIAYLTADAPAASPFASCFRVVETLALDERTLKKELAARGIGTVEIKKRGVDIDPAQLRKRLAPKGPNSATLILTRLGERRVALLAERVTVSPVSHSPSQ